MYLKIAKTEKYVLFSSYGIFVVVKLSRGMSSVHRPLILTNIKQLLRGHSPEIKLLFVPHRTSSREKIEPRHLAFTKSHLVKHLLVLDM